MGKGFELSKGVKRGVYRKRHSITMLGIIYGSEMEEYLRRDISTGTLRLYLNVFTILSTYIQKKYGSYAKCNDISKEDIVGFRDYIELLGAVNGSISTYMFSIKSYYKWLSNKKGVENICEGIVVSVAYEKKKVGFSVEDFRVMLDYCDKQILASRVKGNNYRLLLSVRNKSIIMLLIFTGIRVKDLCGLKWRDVVVRHVKNEQYGINEIKYWLLYNSGRRSKQIEIPIGYEVFKAIQSWRLLLKDYDDSIYGDISDACYLFFPIRKESIERSGDRVLKRSINVNDAYYIVSSIINGSGLYIKGLRTGMSIRHGFGNQFINLTGDVKGLTELLNIEKRYVIDRYSQ